MTSGQIYQPVRKIFLGGEQKLPGGMRCASGKGYNPAGGAKSGMMLRVSATRAFEAVLQASWRSQRTRRRGIMKRWGKYGFLVVAGCLLGLILGQAVTGLSQDSRPVPRGAYIQLNGDFYRALKEEGNTKSYSNDMTQEYLKEIAVSTRFMVETNLQILKNQEHLILMLEPRKK
jgi:hypothetical protein